MTQATFRYLAALTIRGRRAWSIGCLAGASSSVGCFSELDTLMPSAPGSAAGFAASLVSASLSHATTSTSSQVTATATASAAGAGTTTAPENTAVGTGTAPPAEAPSVAPVVSAASPNASAPTLSGSVPIASSSPTPSTSVPATASTATATQIPTFFTAAQGLLNWFDADDATSFETLPEVSAWTDKSGSGFTLRQGTSQLQPTRVVGAIGMKAVVRFDGSDDRLTSSAALKNRAFEGFIVWQSPRVPPTLGSSSLLVNARNFEVNHGHVNGTERSVSACVGPKCTTGSGWHDARFAKGGAANVAYLWNFQFPETGRALVARAFGSAEVRVENLDELPILADTPLDVGNCAAANCGFSGDIAEILIFSRGLSSVERSQVDAYLAAKWTLTTPQE